jgi:hypothetical protein
MTEQPTSPAKRNCDGQPSLAPATCSAEYAVEWNGGEGWKRLAQTKPTEQEAREYAEWVLVKDHQEYRIIEITEKILPNKPS